LRPLEFAEKKTLYRFSKSILILAGAFLVLYGGWYAVDGFLSSPGSSQFWFGIFPAYVGSMMILISLAMRIEWFTDARRFW